jgi:hypothetical protein
VACQADTQKKTNILGAAFFFYLLATREIAHGAARS